MKAQRQKVSKNKAYTTSLHDLSSYVSEDVDVDVSTVENVIELLENDNTVPFIARYRREATGHLEVEKIRMIQESLRNVKAVEDRKESIAKAIGDKVTPEIQCSLKLARTLQDVEEIYAPFKTGSKGTLANRARKLGLDKAVEMIKANPRMTNLSMFVQPNQQGLSHINEVTKGVQHIIADMTYKDREMFDITKNLFESSNVTLDTKISKNSTNDKKFKEYHQKTLSVKSIKAHQILAINRAEEGKILHVKMNCPPQVQHHYLDTAKRKRISSHSSDFVRNLMKTSLDDCYNRLMLPKLMRHKRAELTKNAERESVQVFSRNLRRLLLTPPVNGRTVMGMDPGFKNGCKIAVVNNNGVILNTDVIYPFSGKQQVAEAKLQGLLTTHNCNTIALGNGTACRETERFITKMKETGKLKKNLVYSIVSEDGASIYSVSKEAEAEMPQLDVNLRSAVSIARRLQNPLLELIKIEPKHIGVGMYQHDIPDKLLQTALSGVVEDCVSLVGVDLNASGVHVLKRISGLNERKAKEIVAWREKNGSFSSREQLKKVRGIGEKSFEQCAGFVRIVHPLSEISVLDSDEGCECTSGSNQLSGKRKAGENNVGNKKRKHADGLVAFNRLDATCIHPESYSTAKSLVALTQASLHDIGQPVMKEEMDKLLKSQGISFICQTLKSDPATINFIIGGLCQSSEHDIRADFAKPLFRQGVLSMNDIKPNDRLTGRVTNVTTFGAFVDIGVESQGLIHVSKMPPHTLGVRLGVGDIVEVRLENINKSEQKIGLLLLEIKNSQAELR